MAQKCEDCKVCDAGPAVNWLLKSWRLVWWTSTFWNIGLLVKKCKKCKHALSAHDSKPAGAAQS